MSSKPKIRFNGFDDEWKKGTFIDVFDERTERSEIGELISVTTNYGIKKFSELNRHNNSSDDKSKYKLVYKGDIAYNSMRMWQGASGYSPFNGIVSPAYTVLSPKANANSIFFSYMFKKTIMIQLFKSNSQGITSDTWNLKFPIFSILPTCYPSQLKEQEKIGEYFKTIDELITTHQNKHGKLVNMKKAMLDKMFPKENDVVPQIRFNGFNKDWVESKFENIFEERIERSGNGELLSVTIGSGVRKFSELNRYDNSSYNKSKYKVVCKGDLPYNSMRMWQGACGFSKYNGIVSPAYTVLSPKENSNSIFYSYMFKNSKILQIFKINSQGLTSDTWNLKFPTFSQITTYYPIDVKEQTKIGEFFQNLDNLIENHNKEIVKLQNVKKAMLDKMFI